MENFKLNFIIILNIFIFIFLFSLGMSLFKKFVNLENKIDSFKKYDSIMKKEILKFSESKDSMDVEKKIK